MNVGTITKSIVAGVAGALVGAGLGFLVWWFAIVQPSQSEQPAGFSGIFAGAAIAILLVIAVCLGAWLGGSLGVAWSLPRGIAMPLWTGLHAGAAVGFLAALGLGIAMDKLLAWGIDLDAISFFSVWPILTVLGAITGSIIGIRLGRRRRRPAPSAHREP